MCLRGGLLRHHGLERAGIDGRAKKHVREDSAARRLQYSTIGGGDGTVRTNAGMMRRLEPPSIVDKKQDADGIVVQREHDPWR